MDQHALADCAAALGCEPGDVLRLRDNADLLPALLARIVLALQEKSDSPGAAYQVTAPADSPGEAFVEALARGWGTRPFLAGELIAWAEQAATTGQREVFTAARLLCGLSDDADLTAQILGCALRTLTPKLRITGSRRGSTLWALRDSRD